MTRGMMWGATLMVLVVVSGCTEIFADARPTGYTRAQWEDRPSAPPAAATIPPSPAPASPPAVRVAGDSECRVFWETPRLVRTACRRRMSQDLWEAADAELVERGRSRIADSWMEQGHANDLAFLMLMESAAAAGFKYWRSIDSSGGVVKRIYDAPPRTYEFSAVYEVFSEAPPLPYGPGGYLQVDVGFARDRLARQR